MKTIVSRWNAELNNFWKKVRKAAIWITGAATTIITLNATVTGLTLNPTFITVCSYILVAGAVLGLTAQMTQK